MYPDPKRPWKAIAATVMAITTYLVTQTLVELPLWLNVTLNATAVGITAFSVKNPMVGE